VRVFRDALDLGQGTEIVCGDTEGERRLPRYQKEADADHDDGGTGDERDQEGGELHGEVLSDLFD
jgi:hypothetical protein